jgi:hypothetical protein
MSRTTVGTVRARREVVPGYDEILRKLVAECLTAAIQDSPRNAGATSMILNGRMWVTRFSVMAVNDASSKLMDTWKATVLRAFPGAAASLVIEQRTERTWTFSFDTQRAESKSPELGMLCVRLMICSLAAAWLFSAAWMYKEWATETMGTWMQ